MPGTRASDTGRRATGRIEESYPHLSPLLAGPSDFVVYHKALSAPEHPNCP